MTNVFTAFSCQRTFVIFYLLNSDIAGGVAQSVAHNYAFFVFTDTSGVGKGSALGISMVPAQL